VGLPLVVDAGRLDPLDELVAVVDVEDEQSMTAVLEVVTDARHRHIEAALLGTPRPAAPREEARHNYDRHQPAAEGMRSHGATLVEFLDDPSARRPRLYPARPRSTTIVPRIRYR